MAEDDFSYFREQSFLDTLARYETMCRGTTSDYFEPEELTDIAEYYMIQDRRDDASACIRFALNLHPGSIDPLVFLGRQRLCEEDIDGAITVYNSITDSNDCEVIFFRAEIIMHQKGPEEASQYLESAYFDENKNDIEEQGWTAYDIASLFRDNGYPEQAFIWIERALEKIPNEKDVLQEKADILIDLGNSNEASVILEQLISEDPYNVSAWNSKAEAHLISGNYEESDDAIEYALAIDENNPCTLLLKANALFDTQNYSEAHKIYKRYLKFVPSNETAWFYDGSCLFSLNRYKESLQSLLQARRLAAEINSPVWPHILVLLGDVYAKLGYSDEALDCINKLSESQIGIDADLIRAHTLIIMERRKEGFQLIRDYITNHPNTVEAHYMAGVVLEESDEFKEARTHFRYIINSKNIPKTKIIKKKNTEKNQDYRALSFVHLAYCALQLHLFNEFIELLPIAIDTAPEETEELIGPFIPNEVEVKDFCSYIDTHHEFFLQFMQ